MFKKGDKVRFKSTVTDAKLRRISMRDYRKREFVIKKLNYDSFYSSHDVLVDCGYAIPISYLELARHKGKSHLLTNIFKDKMPKRAARPRQRTV